MQRAHREVLDMPCPPPCRPARAAPARLQLAGITKRYPAVLACSGVARTGAPDAGSMHWNGQAVRLRHPQQARALGIAMVFQHFSLFDSLTVAENVSLRLDQRLSLAEVTGRIRAKASEYGLDTVPLRPVHTLSVGQMQRVEIIRALLADPALLILDEPTSVLTPQAADRLFVVLRQLAARGCSILYISHKLHEIRALCTACTVLRGGRVTGQCNPAHESVASLSRLIMGAEPAALPARARPAGATVLRVQGLSLPRAE